ncbi:sodium-dependent transporter [Thaumasiovibrio subtropicus]|uniref:sodium-dependent transporter n=1 Tax=Thaumasiovibrio subtropicus TaxID=1891207 RepID=UPI000B352ABB|nr:sodium-dependent transporter [Thaumasiovibrio subtropicus]
MATSVAGESRAQFSSKIGFILAAAGSAVGLGNIWGFPTQAASNGGGAFLLIYLFMVFLLGYPLLVAELAIGRYSQANPIKSSGAIMPKGLAGSGRALAVVGLITASCILSFYAILAGWLLGFFISPLLEIVGFTEAATWLETFSTGRNLLLMGLFMAATIYIVKSGVAEGIERWSTRLMPVLVVLFLVLIAYIMTQSGAMAGLKMFLVPDFSQVDSGMIHSAMGQAFFSLSLGACTMMVYGSYLRKDADLPKTAGQVALIDTGIAFIAGLLIMPAMFVAQNNGVKIFDEAGNLESSGDLVFEVLPAMFETMGGAGLLVSIIFFALMVIAALTSSISLLEVPVSTASEELNLPRSTSSWLIGGVISVLSVAIIFNFGWLFDAVIVASTEYAQPILGVVFALLVGWVWKRDGLLSELRQGAPEMETSLFWKIWPWYVRVVCPAMLLFVFLS